MGHREHPGPKIQIQIHIYIYIYESPLTLYAHWLGHLPLGTPRGHERPIPGAQVLSGIRYMSTNTGLIFSLMKYMRPHGDNQP